MECSNCGGGVYLDEDEAPDEAGAHGDVVWCSEVCRQVVVEGKWPSPVGPATHEEMEGWIAEQDRLDGEARRARQAAQARRDAAEQRKFDLAVKRYMAKQEGGN